MTKIETLELELAARKLVEGTKLEWWEVVRQIQWANQKFHYFFAKEPLLDGPRENYELAVAIVEDKPVFVGDTVYFVENGGSVKKRIAKKDGWYSVDNYLVRKFNNRIEKLYSWNPPVPKLPEGFTPRNGGEWIGPPAQWVEVLCRNGTRHVGIAGLMCWYNRDWHEDIIAYRIVKKYEEPKPKTVIVELPIETAEFYRDQYQHLTIAEACRKALKELGMEK